MKKKVTLAYCDECGFNEKDVNANIAVRNCFLCHKEYCSSIKHQEDNYSTFQHFTHKPDLGFICKNDWQIIRESRKYEGLKKLFDHHASGSSFAIAIANYYDGIMYAARKVADEKLRAFLTASWEEKERQVKLRLEKARIEREMREKIEALGV